MTSAVDTKLLGNLWTNLPTCMLYCSYIFSTVIRNHHSIHTTEVNLQAFLTLRWRWVISTMLWPPYSRGKNSQYLPLNNRLGGLQNHSEHSYTNWQNNSPSILSKTLSIFGVESTNAVLSVAMASSIQYWTAALYNKGL